MELKLLKSEQEYEALLEEAEELFDAKADTPEGDKLELISLLLEKYEDEHHHIDPPHPVEAIKFRMEQGGLIQKDLIECFGDKSKVSEVLNKKRPLSLTHIRKLNAKLHIPLEALISEYPVEKKYAN